MPAITTITVNDGESTPVAHTFERVGGIDKNGVIYLRESDGVPFGDNALSISLRRPTNKVKGRLVLKVPVIATETINGVDSPKWQREGIISLDTTFDEQSSIQERKNALTMFVNALANADITEVLQDAKGPW